MANELDTPPPAPPAGYGSGSVATVPPPAPPAGYGRQGVAPPQSWSDLATGLGRSVAQGWVLDPVEGAAQMAGHLPYVGGALSSLVPQSVSDWTSSFEKSATATPLQRGVRIGADILNPAFYFAPELGLGRLAEAAGVVSPLLRGATAGAVGATLQPEQGQFSWGRKGAEAATGAVLGGGLGHLAGAAHARAAAEAAQTAHETQVAAWRTPEHYHPFTREQYGDILAPIGKSAMAPATVGTPELAQVRTIVGNELNSINSQLKLNATGDLMLHLEGIRDNASRDLMHDVTKRQWHEELPPTGPVGNRRLPRPTGIYEDFVLSPVRKNPNMSGRQFQEYVSSIDKKAETLARTKPSNPYYQDNLLMSQTLHSIADRIEEHATPLAGPQDWQRLVDARNSARESYRRWSVMNDAARPERGGVVKPSDMIRSAARRNRTGYGQTWDARKQALENARTRLEPRPAAPPPVPPKTAAEQVAHRGTQALAGLAGYEVGRRLGHPLLGATAGAGLASVLEPERAMARIGRTPAAVGQAAGRVTDLLLPQRTP